MRKGLIRTALALVVVGALFATGNAAFAADTGTDPAVAAALARVADGTFTTADLGLIKKDPEVADSVPDVAAVPQVEVTRGLGTMEPPTSSTTSAVTWCNAWADVWYTQKSLTGHVMYVWHHKVVYCRDGSRVTRFQNRYDYWTNTSGVVYVRALEVNQAGGINTNAAWSHLQRNIEYCVVRYGCYASAHPWSIVTVHGNGTYSYRGASH